MITKVIRLIAVLSMAIMWCSNVYCQSQAVPDTVNKVCSVVTPNDASHDLKDEFGTIGPSIDRNNQNNENEGKQRNAGVWITIAVTVVASFLIPYAVFVVQQMSRKSQEFRAYSRSLYSDNPIEQASAAILLRSFLRKQKVGFLVPFDCTREAKNLLTSLLKTSIPTTLQKNLADGFSYASEMDGQDMQYINMIGALIKPQSRIKYEMEKDEKKKEKFKKDRLSMRRADFFHAVVQECSINNVDAEGAIFLYSILCGTSFKNCILTDACFEEANVSRVSFDQDCELEGASFKNAVGINEVKIRRKTINGEVEEKKLIDYLDGNGMFHKEVDSHYEITDSGNLRVFVSKLGIMSPQQKYRYDNIVINLSQKGYLLETIDRRDYLNTSQLTDVNTHLEKCDGIVIFAFEYLRVEQGSIHKDVESKDNQTIEKEAKVFASPWLHIEAALANGMQMPCFIIYDKDLCQDGMFDKAVVDPDKNLFVMSCSDDASMVEKLERWENMMVEYHHNRLSRLSKDKI